MDDVTATLARYPDSESVFATGDNYLIACWFRGEAARLARALHKQNENNVTKFEPTVVGDGYRFDANEILDAAKDQEMETVVIIGQLPSGELWVSSAVNAGTALVLIHRAINQIVGE